jgi:SOS-response transcriptional repressor LexA
MTMTKSKNSTFELRIYGRSMILGHIIFFQDGVAMEF